MVLSYVSRGYMYMYNWLIRYIYIQCASYINVLMALRLYLTHVVLTEFGHNNGKLIRTNISLYFIKHRPKYDICRKRVFTSRLS